MLCFLGTPNHSLFEVYPTTLQCFFLEHTYEDAATGLQQLNIAISREMVVP